MPEQVAIDNDFLGHLTKIKRHPNVYDLICRFFQALDVSVWMHPLVYDNEAKDCLNETGKKLFAANVVRPQIFSDVWGRKPGGQQYYEMMVQQIYQDFMGVPYPCANVCSDWRRGKSLGEVHTVVMCAFLSWNCFLSDDGDTGKELGGILQERMTHPINIYNRKNRCDHLKGKEAKERCGLTSSELNVLGHTRCD